MSAYDAEPVQILDSKNPVPQCFGFPLMILVISVHASAKDTQAWYGGDITFGMPSARFLCCFYDTFETFETHIYLPPVVMTSWLPQTSDDDDEDDDDDNDDKTTTTTTMRRRRMMMMMMTTTTTTTTMMMTMMMMTMMMMMTSVSECVCVCVCCPLLTVCDLHMGPVLGSLHRVIESVCVWGGPPLALQAAALSRLLYCRKAPSLHDAAVHVPHVHSIVFDLTRPPSASLHSVTSGWAWLGGFSLCVCVCLCVFPFLRVCVCVCVYWF